MKSRNRYVAPIFLDGHVQLQRQYSRELAAAARNRTCASNCQKAEIDRKYARLAQQASLAMGKKKR